MEDFLNDPYDSTQRRQNSGNARWNAEGDQLLNLADLQFTVAPNSSDAHDLRSNYAMFNDNQRSDQVLNTSRDPFLEMFDFLGSPTQQEVSPPLVHGVTEPWMGNLSSDNIYGDGLNLNAGVDPLNNLDLLVLPGDTSNQAASGNVNNNMFSSSQYFSPNSRGANFGHLNSIVEGSVSPSYYHNTFSPTHSRHGSVSIPPPLNSYLLQHALLSPQTNAIDGSFDTLKLPYSGSYLNSPPAMSLSQSTNMNLTPSYPHTNGHLPSNQSYGTGASSVGAIPGAHLRKTPEIPGTPKQLTLEEKAKRRREFHNAVERRRRDLIKEKIKVLGFLVPPSLLTPQVCAVQALLKSSSLKSHETKELIASVRIKDLKPNKAFILQTSVDYIRHLHYVLEKQNDRKKELERAIAGLETPLNSGPVKMEPGLKSELDLLSLEFNPDEFFSAEI